MDFLHYLNQSELGYREERQRIGRFFKRRVTARRFLTALASLPSATDVKSISLSTAYGDDIDVSLAIYLSEERQATTLLREIVRAFHIPIRKAPSWDGKSLTAEFTLDRLAIRVYGYKPSTCKIVTEEVIEPVKDARIAEDGTVYVTRQKSRVVCDPPENE